MPKFNGYRALHTTVIGPQGRPLEIQVRTREMHETAEFGVAAHWLYKRGKKDKDAEWVAWVKQLMDEGTTDEADPREFMKTFRTDLFDEEVHVFTPKGQVKTLPAGSTPIDFAYAVHTDVGHRTVGAKINGRIVPLHYTLQNGDFVEILTSKQGRGPSRDWMSLAKSSRARNKIRQWFSRETRDDAEHKGREALEQALKAQNLPYAKLRGSATLAQVIRETGFKKADDFYLALGSGKLQPGAIVNKVIQRLKTEQVADEAPVVTKAPKAQPVSGSDMGVVVPGVTDVLVRLAKCCTPVPGDPIVGYISLGKGITIHRDDCPNVKALRRNPERFTPVDWDGATSAKSFRVQIAVDSWDRPRLLEDVARTFAEHGANIVSYGGVVEDQLAKNWYTAEVGDVKGLRSLLTALRNLEAVFDAYRVTPVVSRIASGCGGRLRARRRRLRARAAVVSRRGGRVDRRARPGSGRGASCVDLGAGTGKLTRLLVPTRRARRSPSSRSPRCARSSRRRRRERRRSTGRPRRCRSPTRRWTRSRSRRRSTGSTTTPRCPSCTACCVPAGCSS